MSVWNNIAKALGFGGDAPDADEENWQVDDAAVPAEPQPEPAGPVEIDPAQVHAIFQRVVEVFNNTLPEFLSRSVDPEKQRKYLYDSLDNSMRNYLADVQQRVAEHCAAQWQAERDRLKEESAQLRKRTDELEAKKSDMADKQLSTDRQKRALSERVRDLEDQIVKLEAEKEQLDIENKCMLNKAKAASVLENEIEELRQENMRLNDARQAMDVRTDINDAMGSEFKKQAAEASAELRSLREKMQGIDDAMARKDARIDDLDRQVKIKDSKIAELMQALDEHKEEAAASVTPEQWEEIQLQIGRFEEVKTKLDARIEKLRASLKDSQAENQSLRDTIKDNLVSASKTQQEMNERIESLTRELDEARSAMVSSDTAVQYVKRPDKKRQSKRNAASAGNAHGTVDQLINADWLVSAPPEESPMHAAKGEDTFGYTAPQRKPRPPMDNDTQLSLFDL